MNQHKEMLKAGSQSCPDRIVSIFQPHVRLIPKGKTKVLMEFGSNMGVSLDDGSALINTLNWYSYHEEGELIGQGDKIYVTRENRQLHAGYLHFIIV